MHIQNEKKMRDANTYARRGAFTLGSYGLVAAMVLVVSFLPARAANVTLKTNDAAGTSSFTGATNWSNGAVPSAGNAYFTGALTLRTPNPTASGNNYIFAGDSLSIDSGGRFLLCSGGETGSRKDCPLQRRRNTVCAYCA